MLYARWIREHRRLMSMIAHSYTPSATPCAPTSIVEPEPIPEPMAVPSGPPGPVIVPEPEPVPHEQPGPVIVPEPQPPTN
jgi:hypothetical protein